MGQILHTYPTSIDMSDLAHTAETMEPRPNVTWTRSRTIDGCALCAAGICQQRVELLENGNEHIVHGRIAD